MLKCYVSKCYMLKCYISKCYMSKCYFGEMLYVEMLLRRNVIWRHITEPPYKSVINNVQEYSREITIENNGYLRSY